MELNRYIDHTLLKADATKDRIIKLCNEAKEHHFRTVCVNPCWISLYKELLAGSDVGVCCVIGFPLGANSTAAKAFEAKDAIKLGADEVDMVINIGKLIDNDLDYVINDIKACKEAVGDHVLKVIIETCLLSDEQKVTACKCIKEAKADFVKTSTGFSISGANLHDVKLLKDTVKDELLVKAAGGVKTHQDLLDMIANGADRIGTSSGVALICDKPSNSDY